MGLPVSSWACLLKNKTCISLSHQAAVLNKHAPQPAHTDLVGRALLKYYAPASAYYGFHFKAYDKNIFTPGIRRQIRELQPGNKGHYTVYLPAYDDQRIIKVLRECGHTSWQVFSKHNKRAFVEKNVAVYPVSNEAFINSMAGAECIICGDGFETPAEAMSLGKKLLVMPMTNQYEQYCNAAALQSLAVPVIKNLKKKHCDKIIAWIKTGQQYSVDYPDVTTEIIEEIVNEHAGTAGQAYGVRASNTDFSLKEFRRISIKKILAYIAG